MLKQRLSQVLGGIKKGYAVDTFEGGFPVAQVVNAPDAQSNTAVHAAMSLTTVAQVISGSITDPDVYRALRLVGNQADVYANVTVRGLDRADRAIQETILVSGNTAVETNQPFKEVTKIELPIKTANGQTVSVGISNKLGLYRPPLTTALELLKVDNSVESEVAFSQTYGTFTPDTDPNGSRVYEANYLTDIF